MRYVVVNADDFGFSEGVNRGIVEAHTKGVVTSASVMCTTPGFDGAVEQLREHPTLDPGVHVSLTVGRPVSPPSQVRTLLGRDGRFRALTPFLARLCVGAIDPEEAHREIYAQVRRFLDSGLRPSHFDSHHHIHLLPWLARILGDVAREFRVPFLRCPSDVTSAFGLSARERVIRWLSRRGRAAFLEQGLLLADNLVGLGLRGRRFEPEPILTSLKAAQDHTVTEWVCHPGQVDDELLSTRDPYTHWREHETRVLISLRSDGRLAARGITLARFSDLAALRAS